jgi:hypothetical protein
VPHLRLLDLILPALITLRLRLLLRRSPLLLLRLNCLLFLSFSLLPL